MKTTDVQRIAREAARDFANSTAWLDCEQPSHKEMATQALAQIIAKHIRDNFYELLTVRADVLNPEST